jgi:hypothetical protein
MVGDYAFEAMAPALKANAIAALATLHGALGIDPSTLRLHREDPKTTHLCPGVLVSKDDFIAETTAKLSAEFPGEHPHLQTADA